MTIFYFLKAIINDKIELVITVKFLTLGES